VPKRKINFEGVAKEIRSGGRAAHVPPGDYLLKIVKGEWTESPEKETPGINWRFTVVKPEKYKGKTIYDSTWLSAKALWNLRNLIFAATGKNVAGKSLSFDPEMIEGKVVMATVDDDEYKKDKKTVVRSRPVDYQPKEKYGETDDEDEDDDEDTEEDDEEEEEDDEELEDVDLDDL
jgi:hypothetical protein